MQHIPEKWNCPFEKTSKRKERMFIENNMEKTMYGRLFGNFIRVFLPSDRHRQCYGSTIRAGRK
ncbi:MAG: hypothetical protein ACLTVG_03270 [Coprococcus sp.]|jgi:hypothetical protein|uniref:hypothetical protein n=1 Tax=Coprococcus phoceensis TaxID=1870993 RepID=UPI0032B70D9C